MKILSKSKVAQVFLFFFSPPPTLPLWLNTPQLIGALISFIFFFPREVTQAGGVKDGERYVCHEAREHVSPQPANSSSNTQARGWMRARLAFRTSEQHQLCHTN